MSSSSAMVRLATGLMRLVPPKLDASDFSLWEVFLQPAYQNGTNEERERFRRKSAQHRFEYETESDSLACYFPQLTGGWFEGKHVLDLGCFTGGRLVCWAERYRFGSATGIDINPLFAEAARELAQARHVTARFDVGVGEQLPYADASFDCIISYDVLEHVRDVAATLAECRRVLRPSGHLLVCFPPYFQPLESHLGLWTRLPALHLVFGGATLARAAHAVSVARGPEWKWAAREDPELAPWERSPSLNGMTVRRFYRLAAEQGWRVVSSQQRPILTDGRRARRQPFRAIAAVLAPLAKLPIVEEIFLGRICCVLENVTPASRR